MEPPLPLRNEVRFGLPKNCFENEPLLSRVGNLTWIPAVWGVFSKGPDFVYIYVLQRIPAEPKAVQGCLSRLQSAHTNGRHSCIHVRTSVYQEIDTKSLLAFTKRHSLPTSWKNLTLIQKKVAFHFSLCQNRAFPCGFFAVIYSQVLVPTFFVSFEEKLNVLASLASGHGILICNVSLLSLGFPGFIMVDRVLHQQKCPNRVEMLHFLKLSPPKT